MIDGLGRGFVHGTTTVGAHGGLEGRSELRGTRRTCGFSSGLREGSAPPSQGEGGRFQRTTLTDLDTRVQSKIRSLANKREGVAGGFIFRDYHL